MKYIAVEGCSLSEPTASITTPASTKVKLNGKGAYRGGITIQITGYTSETITVTGSGSGSETLNGSAQKVKIEGSAAVLEGDSVDVTVNGQAVSGTTTIPATEIVNVKIQSAGQTKVQGA